jgi:hypothetical protein
MSIILNEREFAENALEKCSLNKKPAETLYKIAKYYSHEGYKCAEIKVLLESFLLKCDPDISIVKWQDCIDRAARAASKYALVEIESVPITEAELKTCASLKGKQIQRILFTLICLAKLGNAINESNNNWVNKEDKEIFRLANVVTPVKRQSLMLNDLRSWGLVQFSKKVDNINIKITCIDDITTPVLQISDFRNIGYQYLRYCGEAYFECQSCGLTTRRNNNRQKYCPDCAIEINRQKTLDNWNYNSMVS